MAIIDERLLLRVLAGTSPRELPTVGIYTTGSWYYRLARAVFDLRMEGSLSRALHGQPPGQQAQIITALDDLPEWVGLIEWRQLVPVMRRLDPAWRLNMLAAEAIAAALVTGAAIRVSVPNPNIDKVADVLGIDYGVITTN